MAWKTKLFNIEAFAPWVKSITYKGPFFDGTMPQVGASSGQWHACLFPNITLVVNEYETVVTALIKHVTNEVLLLICDCLNINEKPTRIVGICNNHPQRHWLQTRELVDARYILTWIMVKRFNLSQSDVAKSLGYLPCTANHAIKECNNVKEIKAKIKLVLSTYPFLKPDGYGVQ
jgi:hypothetical protein